MSEQVMEHNLKFLSVKFIEAMNDIGRYGHEKYGEQSFQHRRLQGDTSRGEMNRCSTSTIGEHVREHYRQYMMQCKHDHFDTLTHQLAAVAFNAMMEFYFAGLEDESNAEIQRPETDAIDSLTGAVQTKKVQKRPQPEQQGVLRPMSELLPRLQAQAKSHDEVSQVADAAAIVNIFPYTPETCRGHRIWHNQNRVGCSLCGWEEDRKD